MKLSDIRPNLETSQDLEEQFFSIQDQGMIFDILRGKMYSNPILAICREISCNARDAHREVGKNNVPIEIYLPNNLEPYFKIKDFGPGISPDRMSNVFIKYTASTKRSDNIQTGGFGLGAKTPFSYSDSFSIVTNYNGTAYNYSCVIDPSRVGKLLLLSETPTKESNGTEIIIPVKSADFHNFNQWIENATRHWDIKPVFRGGTVNYQVHKKILEGNKWTFAANDSYYQSQAKIIIDGIEYPLDTNSLRTYADSSLLDSTRSVLMLEFGIGELTLSANRESIYLDDSTKSKIKHRLEDVKIDIKKKLEDKIASFTSLWEANIFYRKELQAVFHTQTFLGQLYWNGYKLENKYMPLACPGYIFSKGKYSRKHGNDPNKIVRGVTQSLVFDENSVLYVNDLPLKNPTPKHLKKAFENHPKATSIQLICPTDKITIADLNKSINLDQMKPNLLSSVTKASGRAYTPPTYRLLVYKFDIDAVGFRQVSYASIEEDASSHKVLCLSSKDLYNNSRKIELKNKKNLNMSAIKSLALKNTSVSFYSVDESADQNRIEEEFSDFQSLDDFIEEKIIKNKNVDYVQMKHARNLQHEIDSRLVKDEDKIASKIISKDSLFLKRKKIHAAVKTIADGDMGLLDIYESFNGIIDDAKIKQWIKNNPEFDIVKINEEYHNQYPLTKYLNTYNYTYHKMIAPLVHYINLIDKEKEEKNV